MKKMRLDLSGQRLTTLVGINLTGVTELDCSYNNLTTLDLSSLTTLKTLFCYENQLTSLGNLPASLISLYCFDNQLTSLGNLPNSLKCLFCGQNKLTTLENLPSSLCNLDCTDNPLTKIDYLPDGLKSFTLSRLNLSLPDIPWSLHNTWNNEIFNRHNEKRQLLNLERVDFLPDKDEWDRIIQLYLENVYHPSKQ